MKDYQLCMLEKAMEALSKLDFRVIIHGCGSAEPAVLKDKNPL